MSNQKRLIFDEKYLDWKELIFLRYIILPDVAELTDLWVNFTLCVLNIHWSTHIYK